MTTLKARNELTPEEAARSGPRIRWNLARAIDDRNTKAYKRFGTFKEYCKQVHGVTAAIVYRRISDSRHSTKRQISERLRWEIWERDNFTCKYCGTRRFLSVDHVVPECEGGTIDPSNLVTACRKCNSKKGTSSLGAFQFRRAFSMFKQVCEL